MDTELNARRRATTVTRFRVRELAERTSSGTQVLLLWRQGTRQLWVEVRESATDQTLRVRVRPEQALDAFRHPYAYAPSPLTESDLGERGSRVSRREVP